MKYRETLWKSDPYATTVELLDTAKSYLDAVSSLTQGNLDKKNDDVKFYKADENGNLEVIVNESYFKFKENDDLKTTIPGLYHPVWINLFSSLRVI